MMLSVPGVKIGSMGTIKHGIKKIPCIHNTRRSHFPLRSIGLMENPTKNVDKPMKAYPNKS